MQFLFLLNCMIVKICSSVILRFRSQHFLFYILFKKFFFLIHEDFIKPAVRVCFWPRIGLREICIKDFIVMVHK